MPYNLIAYRSIANMPASVRNECRQMGHSENSYWNAGQMRKIVTDAKLPKCDREYICKSAVILEVDGRIVGWTCYYTDYMGDKFVSVWVKTRYRGCGFGMLLIRESYRRWNKYNPTVFRLVETVWNRWNRWNGQDIN